MPHENTFIATDLSLRPPDSEAGDGKLPSLLIKNGCGELYYRKDTTFMQPRAYIYYLLRSPLQLQSAENAALLDLMVMCLLQNLVEDVYPANLASCQGNLVCCSSCIGACLRCWPSVATAAALETAPCSRVAWCRSRGRRRGPSGRSHKVRGRCTRAGC